MSEREIVTRVAKAGWNEHRFHGHAVFGELVSNLSITGLLSLAVTGRMPDEDTVLVLDELAVTLTLADPRFWPLKVSRIAASFGETALGTLLGALSVDRALIGSNVPKRAAQWLAPYVSEREAGRPRDEVLAELLDGQERLEGFGIPVRRVDERTECLKERFARLGRDRLPHWKGFMEVAETLRDQPRMVPNHAGAIAAALLDCGYSSEEIGDVVPLLPLHTFLANAVEGAKQQSAILRRLPKDCVDYQGQPARKSPRALAAEGSTAPTASKSD